MRKYQENVGKIMKTFIKKIPLYCLVVSPLMAACTVLAEPNVSPFVNKKLLSVLVYYFDLVPMSTTMDNSPEDVLSRKKDLRSCVIAQMDTLSTISELLSVTPPSVEDSVIAFDTDFVAILTYEDGTVDTLGIPLNLKRGFISGSMRYINARFVDYVIRAVSDRDRFLSSYVLNECTWKGDYRRSGRPNYAFHSHLGKRKNQNLFSNTPADKLACFMAAENYDSIDWKLKLDPSLMYVRENDGHKYLVEVIIDNEQDSILEICLRNGFNPNYVDTMPLPSNYSKSQIGAVIRGLTPLMIACCDSYGNNCGRLLIKYGAKVNDVSNFPDAPCTPLLSAIYSRNYSMCKCLIENGADIELGVVTPVHAYALEREYRTPLDETLVCKYFKMTYLLLSLGANRETGYIQKNGGLKAMLDTADASWVYPSDREYLAKIKRLLYPEDN